MTGAAWVLLVVAWLLGCALVVALRMLRSVEAAPPAVDPLPRQESTDKLPISLALFAAWTRPANGRTEEQLERVREEVRRLHPDLAGALDRAVAASRDRAEAQAVAAPREAVPAVRSAVAEQHGQIRRAECAAGRHLWRGVPGMDVEECTRGECTEIRTVA